MYTFLCAQMFRRDEYASHIRNVHCDIHAGLNGWMECRCPLAHYGCTYSVRRLYPTHEGAMVVYSNVLESFGVQPYVPPSLLTEQQEGTSPKGTNINCAVTNKQKEMTPEIVTSRNYDSAVQINGTLRKGSTSSTEVAIAADNDTLPDDEKSGDVSLLTSLPFEVLRCIAHCLDSYSLSNLALTCLLLRGVCCDLLEERGIVVLQWERQLLEGRCHWAVTGKRWMFSTAFTPVNTWGITNTPHMSEHLLVCPYNDREERRKQYTEPMRLPGVFECEHSSHFNEVMERMYPGVKFGKKSPEAV